MFPYFHISMFLIFFFIWELSQILFWKFVNFLMKPHARPACFSIRSSYIEDCSLTCFIFCFLFWRTKPFWVGALLFLHFSSSKGSGRRDHWLEIRVKLTYIWIWFISSALALVTVCYMNPPDNFLQENKYYLEVSPLLVLTLLFIVKSYVPVQFFTFNRTLLS